MYLGDRDVNVRNLIYTILSRKFWLGVTIGYILGSVFLPVDLAHASPSTGEAYTVASSTSSTGPASCSTNAGQGLTIIFDGSIYPNLTTYMSAYMFARNSSGSRYYATLRDGVNGPIVALATTTDFVGSNYLFNFPQHTRASTTYELTIENRGGPITWTMYTPAYPSVYVKTTANTCTSGMTPAFYAFQATSSPASTNTVVPMYTPYLNAKLSSMNCTYTSSTTSCAPQYASSTTDITLPNIVQLQFVFIMAFFMAYWITKRLTS